MMQVLTNYYNNSKLLLTNYSLLAVTKQFLNENRLFHSTPHSHLIFKYKIKQSWCERSLHTKRELDINNSIYNELKIFITNNPINKETQLKLEKFLIEYEYTNSSSQVISGIDTELFSYKLTNFLIPYKSVLTTKINKFLSKKSSYKALGKEKHYYYLANIIENLPIDYILSIILGRFLRIISNYKLNLSNNNHGTDIASEMGDELTRKYFHELYLIEKNNDKAYTFSDWKKDNKKYIDCYTEIDLKIKMAGVIIQWMEDSDLISKKYVTMAGFNKQKHHIFIPGSKLNQNWDSHMEILTPGDSSLHVLNKKSVPVMSLPIRLPMICPPNRYENKGLGKGSLGGYLLNDQMFTDEVILENHAFKERTKIKDQNIIYNLINNINSVGYKINTALLNFIYTNPNYFGDELLDESYNHPLAFKEKLTKLENKKLQQYYSKLALQKNILHIANIYALLPEFYFVTRLDSRGRLYCITEYLHYQSNELAKSLLLFSKTSQIHRVNNINSINYLKMYGANCFGNKIDKLSGNDKMNWVDKNLDQIKNFRNGLLISQAENKFLFTAFCLEYNRWLDFYENTTETYFNTNLPIQLDASCNGFQHLVLLSLDNNLTKELNLSSSTFDDKPKDFYGYILVHVLSAFEMKLQDPKLESELRGRYERLCNFNIQRSLIKKCVMTIPYNATNPRLIENIIDSLECWDDNGETWYGVSEYSTYRINYKDLSVLVIEIKNTIDYLAPQVANLIKYLKGIGYICSLLEISIPWSLPSGLEVKQSYLKVKSVQLKPFLYSKTSFTIQTYTNKIDRAKQVRAFMPNLIHSLDAVTLTMLVDEYFKSGFKVKNLFTVHDCFGMPINQVEYVIDLLKYIYGKLYFEEQYLVKLDVGILNHIKHIYGESCYNPDTRKITINGKEIDYPDINTVLSSKILLPESIEKYKTELNEANYLIK